MKGIAMAWGHGSNGGMPPQSTIFDGGTGSVPGFGARRRAGPMVSYFIMYRT